MESNEDLLVRLYRWAHRQGENFTTEAFAHVLEHLVLVDPAAAARVLTWVVAATFEISVADVQELDIQTQYSTEDHGTPDLRLLGDDLEIIVEVKLDGSLGAEQVNAYRAELARSSKGRRVLVGLVGRAPAVALPDDVVARHWSDLAVELEQVLAAAKGIDPFVEIEINQFLRLLSHHRLLPVRRVESPLASAIEQHRDAALSHPDRPTIFNSRVRRFDAFDNWPELEPLRALFGQMGEVLDRRGLRRRLESGQSGKWPWIGYTINNLAYFVEVNLDEPHRVTFTRSGDGVAPESFDKTMGRLERQRGRYRWCNDLDLVNAHYFGADVGGQVALLEEFVGASLAYAECLRPAARG